MIRGNYSNADASFLSCNYISHNSYRVRRMTSECRQIISEYKKIPQKELGITLAVINCDDFNDHRKFLKKNSGITFSLLCGNYCQFSFFKLHKHYFKRKFSTCSDPTKKFMDASKCRANKRLLSALMIMEISTGKILKVWYENDWDAFTTKDLLVDELRLYRKNPTLYAQNQIGLR